MIAVSALPADCCCSIIWHGVSDGASLVTLDVDGCCSGFRCVPQYALSACVQVMLFSPLRCYSLFCRSSSSMSVLLVVCVCCTLPPTEANRSTVMCVGVCLQAPAKWNDISAVYFESEVVWVRTGSQAFCVKMSLLIPRHDLECGLVAGRHSVDLFLDFINIFRKLLIILSMKVMRLLPLDVL